tara:strand:+ start:458 stop:1354 length:897 start_codon:yes stop_codon:yes gene_type:complete
MGYDREEEIMVSLANSIYTEFITRRRWKLTEGVWIIHGFLLQTKKEFGSHMELFYNEEQKKIIERDMEAGRLSDAEIDRLLAFDTNEVSTFTRVIDIFKKERVWEQLPDDWGYQPYDEDGNLIEPDHEARWVEESCRNLWHMINTRADLKQCELPYVDENGTWHALSPLAEWNAEYLVSFAQDVVDMDVGWLIEDIERYKKKHPSPVSLTDTKKEVEEPQREKNYTPFLLKTGKELQADGIEVNVGTVIDRWKNNPPDGIKDATDDNFKYRHVDGHWAMGETKNLKRTIKKYFKKSDS